VEMKGKPAEGESSVSAAAPSPGALATSFPDGEDRTRAIWRRPPPSARLLLSTLFAVKFFLLVGLKSVSSGVAEKKGGRSTV
jgi:hypothetical protein